MAVSTAEYRRRQREGEARVPALTPADQFSRHGARLSPTALPGNRCPPSSHLCASSALQRPGDQRGRSREMQAVHAELREGTPERLLPFEQGGLNDADKPIVAAGDRGRDDV
jgi:hypothetical protein